MAGVSMPAYVLSRLKHLKRRSPSSNGTSWMSLDSIQMRMKGVLRVRVGVHHTNVVRVLSDQVAQFALVPLRPRPVALVQGDHNLACAHAVEVAQQQRIGVAKYRASGLVQWASSALRISVLARICEPGAAQLKNAGLKTSIVPIKFHSSHSSSPHLPSTTVTQAMSFVPALGELLHLAAVRCHAEDMYAAHSRWLLDGSPRWRLR